MNIIWMTLLSYAELGLILALAYALFRGVRGVLQRRIDSAGMILVARILFGVMLVSPLVAHWLLTLPARDQNATAGGAATTVDEIAAMLSGISGMFSRQFTIAEGSPTGSFLSRLDPEMVRGTILTLGIALCVGLIIALARAIVRVKELHAVVCESVPLRRLGRVSIVVSDRVSVPFSTAIFGRAHVVLPVSLLQDPLLLRVTVRHELQHYRRLDPLWAVALELFRVFYFWNPAARGWTRDLSDLQELACDEAVIRRGVPAGEYGKCLLRVAEMAVAERVVASTAMATISDRGAHLRRRIDMLFHEKTSRHSRAWVLGLATLSSMLLLLLATTAAANWPAAGFFAGSGASSAVASGTASESVTSTAQGSGTGSGVARGVASSPTDSSIASTGSQASHATGHADGRASATDCENSNCDEVVEVAVTSTLPDLEFRDADGTTVTLSSLDGKVVVVEFWASWCKFCQREVTQMKALHDLLESDEFQMVGVSLSESAEDTQKFIEEHGVSWPQMHAEGGWASEAGEAFGVKGVPARYLIDRSGQVTNLPRGNPERMAKLILDALEGNQVMTATAR